METIERDDLKESIDRGDKIKLVMAMHEHHFAAAHIPGSVQLFALEDAEQRLRQDDDIIAYCSDRSCAASHVVAQKLVAAGYEHVRHYPGGLSEWQAAGYPLEGSLISA
jgi:rhodanese-related sulfurtransferase